MKQQTKAATRSAGAKKSHKAANTTVRSTKELPIKVRAAQHKERAHRPDSKLGIVVGMLRSDNGATIEALSKATGWQTHSVRGAISGAIKKTLGVVVTSTKADGVRTYRISD